MGDIPQEWVEKGAAVLLATPGDYPGDERAQEWAEHLVAAVLAAILPDVRRAVGEETLRDAARFIEEDMADAWGGDASWLTTGNHVAKIVAATLRSLASPTDRDG